MLPLLLIHAIIALADGGGMLSVVRIDMSISSALPSLTNSSNPELPNYENFIDGRICNISSGNTGIYITALPNDWLKDPMLTTIYFDDNPITMIGDSAFSQLKSLVYISMVNTSLSIISKSVFSSAPGLTSLILDSTHITKIDDGAFDSLKKLLTLSMSRTTIYNLRFVKNLGSLQSIYASENQITSLPSGCLSSLLNLTHLNLDRNPLVRLEPNALPNSLTFISMDHCQIDTLSNGVLPPSLGWGFFNNNPINTIEEGFYVPEDSDRDMIYFEFQGCTVSQMPVQIFGANTTSCEAASIDFAIKGGLQRCSLNRSTCSVECDPFCVNGYNVVDDGSMACQTLQLRENLSETCRDELSAFQRFPVNSVHAGSHIEVKGLDRCFKGDLFNYVIGRITFSLFFYVPTNPSLQAPAPGLFTMINSDTMNTLISADNFSINQSFYGIVSASDGSGTNQTLVEWEFSVKPPLQGFVIGSYYQVDAMNSSDCYNLSWGFRNKWALGGSYSIASVKIIDPTFHGAPIKMSLISYTLINAPPGFGVGVRGGILGSPTVNGNYTSSLFAVYTEGGGASVLLANIEFEVQLPDTAFPFYGPNARPCEHGKAVDKPEFNKHFSCDCSGSGFTGSNCDEIDLPLPIKALIIGLGVLAAFLSVASIVFLCSSRLLAANRKTVKTRRLSLIVNMGFTPEDEFDKEYAVLDAIDNDCLRLVPQLLDRGASASSRHKTKHLLPHSLVLQAKSPNEMVLQRLFESHIEIDAHIGEQLQDEVKFNLIHRVFMSLAEQNSKEITALKTTSDLNAEDIKDSQQFSTILHHVVQAHCFKYLDLNTVCLLVEPIIRQFPELLEVKDSGSRTAAMIADFSRDSVDLHRMLSIVVHNMYQLPSVESHFYKSESAFVLPCRILASRSESQTDHDECPLVLKLMKDFSTWNTEVSIYIKSQSNRKIKSAVVQVHSAAYIDEDIDTCLQGSDTFIRKYPRSIIQANHHSIARNLMAEYPYCICIAQADRSLFEIMAMEMPTIQSVSSHAHLLYVIGKNIKCLHDCQIVHGDIKPKNIVRTDNSYKLIDFDMSLSVKKKHQSLRFPQYYADKVSKSNAYACPELVRWSLAVGENDDTSIEPPTMNPFYFDIWSFGMVMFEVLSGTTIFDINRDKLVRPSVTNCPSTWYALCEASLLKLHHLHQGSDAVTAVDLLQWIFDPDIDERPKSMEVVLEHAFFMRDGTLRVQRLVEQIKLLSRIPSDRYCRRVMISYCWEDSQFVLGKLAMNLARRVSWLWLDRLGGDRGMKEWKQQSMKAGIEGADVVIAVLSPNYIKSRSCGFEMDYAGKIGKPIIPCIYKLPDSDWPPSKVGELLMDRGQFTHPERSSDHKLYIDFTPPVYFDHKFEHELVPRLVDIDSVVDGIVDSEL